MGYVARVSFSDLLQGWMSAHRYNGADAAMRLGVAPSTVARWLSGKAAPGVKRVDELAEIMGVPAADIALAVVAASKADPWQRVETLLEAVLVRLEGVEARQREIDTMLGAAAPPPAKRSRRPDA